MNVRQIGLVLKREYITRLKSKAFILTTILIPLGMVSIIAISIAITVWETPSEHTIGIVDRTDVLYPRLVNLNEERYTDMSSYSLDSLRAMVVSEEIDGYILFDEENIDTDQNAELVYSGSGGIQLLTTLEDDVREAIRQERLDRANVSDEVKEIYERRAGLNTRKLTKEGVETEDNLGLLTGIGVLMGVIIFGIVLGYGGLITRSVVEEKTSRIIEIITSSVRPIELLFGKITGVGALAVTQVAIWIAAGIGLSALAAPIAALFVEPQNLDSLGMPEQAEQPIDPAMFQLPSIDSSVIVLFFVFLILGFLIYSSMFAAIGSAADSETDTQQFMVPVMLPIMIAYFLLFKVMEAPDTNLAVISSLIPFFSPILMVTRIAITDVPVWQTGLAILFMIGTFLGTIWLSGKIYSVGILSYGKSASFRELLKWIRQG